MNNSIKAIPYLIATDKRLDGKYHVELLDTAHTLWIDKRNILQKGIPFFSDSNVIPQHLYLTIDEKTKEGDRGWFLDNTGKILQISDEEISIANEDKRNGINNIWKIVATTNSELWMLVDTFDRNQQLEKQWGSMPKIPTSFIEQYIKFYNEGSPIKEVWLEMIGTGKLKDFVQNKDNPIVQAFSPHRESSKLKLTPDGCIVTKPEYVGAEESPPQEKMYTRQQLIEACHSYDTFTNSEERMSHITKREWFGKNYPVN